MDAKYNIIDNIIYTSECNDISSYNGVGDYYYTKMTENRNKIAQIDGLTKEEDTFGDLLQRSVRTALTMMDKGLKPGDHISLCTLHHLNGAVPHIASYLSGVLMSAIDPNMSVNEATHLLKQTLPKMIFVCSTAVDLVEEVVKRLNNNAIIVVFGDTTKHIPFSEFLRPHKDEITFKPYRPESVNDVALIVFSSGSTGLPKGICYSHLNILICDEDFSTEHEQILCFTANPYWAVFPVYLHISIKFGFPRRIYPFFNANNPWELFSQPVGYTFLSILQALTMVRTKPTKQVDLHNLKILCVGGNPATTQQLNEIKCCLPYTEIRNTYAQTELFRIVFRSLPIGMKFNTKYLGSVGTIRDGINYKVVDVETGKVLGPNQTGELRLQSKSQFVGYFNQDSSECFDSEGWVKTGDLFYYNEDLYFFTVRRIKESFKYLSYHISPIEIENVILNLEPIETAIVVGLPHNTDDNHPLAIIKLKPNKKISAEEVVKHVKENLEDKKHLRGGVRFVDSFPMTVTGKINRLALVQMVINKEI